MKKFALALAAVVLTLNVVNAQQPAVMTSTKPGWHKIGETTASMKSEKDEIAVMGADKFKAIMLKVTDASVHIASLVVYYEGGDAQNINVASDMKAGQESKVFELKGGTREIKRVGFVYKSLPNSNNDKAHIELYGMK
jgi:hypothetical protein